MTQEPRKPREGEIREAKTQGEGDYVAGGRRFQDAERSFAERDSLAARKAREAAEALDGPEAEALEGVLRSIGESRIPPHPTTHTAGAASDPHIDENLDEGLEETFPASDPVSISRGAD